MDNIFEVKYKVMQDKIQKLINIIKFCYIEKEKGEQEALLKVMQIIKTKYAQSFEKIMNSKKINKSLKYKQLEAIVIQGMNKIEIQIARNINQNKDLIRQTILKRYESLEQIEDIDERIEEIEKAKETCSYFRGYIDDQTLADAYVKSKFEALVEKTKINILEQKEKINVFKEVEDKDELKTYEDYLKKRIISQAKTESILAFKIGDNKKQEKIQDAIKAIIKQENKKIKFSILKRKEGKNILVDDELLRQYIMLDIKQNLTENKKYIGKLPIFDIHKLQLTDNQKSRKNDVKHKILYAYLTQISEDTDYSIEKIKKILEKFGLNDNEKETLRLLCKTHKYDNLLELIEAEDKISEGKLGELQYLSLLMKKTGREIEITKIKVPKKITKILVKLRITPNKYEDTPVFHPYIIGKESKAIETNHTFEDGMKVDSMYKALQNEVGKNTSKFNGTKSEYEEKISPELNELVIWNKFIEIDEKGQYVVAISLDDFEELPVDETKLEFIDDKDMQEEYIEMRTRSLFYLIEYCIPDDKLHKNEKHILKTKLRDVWKILDEIFYNVGLGSELLPEDLEELNKLNEAVINYVKENVMSIFQFGEEKLQQINKEMHIENSTVELKEINTINEYIEDSYSTLFKNEWLMKKFEVLCREILEEDIRNLKNPNVEEILKNTIFPYCSKKEIELFEEEFRRIIEYIIINKETRIPIENEIRYITLNNLFKSQLREVRNKVLKEEIEDKEIKEVVGDKIEEQEK